MICKTEKLLCTPAQESFLIPTITRTPVSLTNSYSNFSIRIEVVGPTDTISYFSSPSGRMIEPACRIPSSLSRSFVLPNLLTLLPVTTSHLICQRCELPESLPGKVYDPKLDERAKAAVPRQRKQ